MKPSSTGLFTAALSIICVGICLFCLTVLFSLSKQPDNDLKQLPDHLHSFILIYYPQEI